MTHPAVSVSATEAFFASPEQAHFARQWTAGYVDELRNPGGMEEYPLSNAQALKLRKLFTETAEQRGTKFTFGEDEESPSGSRLASTLQLGMTMTKRTALIDLEASWTPSWRMRWAKQGSVSRMITRPRGMSMLSNVEASQRRCTSPEPTRLSPRSRHLTAAVTW
jgi:hypothetical protein